MTYGHLNKHPGPRLPSGSNLPRCWTETPLPPVTHLYTRSRAQTHMHMHTPHTHTCPWAQQHSESLRCRPGSLLAVAATGLPGPAHRDTQSLSLRALRRVLWALVPLESVFNVEAG